MSAISILAMAMVICLFGGYLDSPNQRRISTAAWAISEMFIRKAEVTKERASS
jgi:hypothetical protein